MIGRLCEAKQLAAPLADQRPGQARAQVATRYQKGLERWRALISKLTPPDAGPSVAGRVPRKASTQQRWTRMMQKLMKKHPSIGFGRLLRQGLFNPRPDGKRGQREPRQAANARP